MSRGGNVNVLYIERNQIQVRVKLENSSSEEETLVISYLYYNIV